MRRIRVALFLLALAILAPVCVLAWQALHGLAYERSVRHQTVAERAFEEMERALSDFLSREEARPASEYRFYLAESGERSPLARGLEEPFVVGAFEIDADGAVRTPLAPRGGEIEQARARGDWPPPPEVEQAIARILAAVGDGYAQSAAPESAQGERRSDAALAARAAQAPGTTRPLADAAVERFAALAPPRPAEEKDDATAYDLLQSFNRSVRERSLRKQKVEEAEPGAFGSAGAESADAERQAGTAIPGSEWREAPLRPPASKAAPASPPRGQARLEAAPPRAESDEVAKAVRSAVAKRSEPPRKRAAAEPAAPAARVRVSIDPMQGRLSGADHLLLARSVQVGRETLRQGLVLDRAALGRWLERRALAETGLARVARLRFDPAGAPPQPAIDPADFVFRHRFGEPFDPLAAELELSPLPGVGSPGAIYALVALLLLLGAVGVFALHRMVSVVVGFAERRSNFVAAVTHELKTPLTAIRMYAEMLRDGLVPSEAKRDEYARTITDESERLSRLIDNVLEFARLERGRRELSLRAGVVAPVLEEAVAKLASHAARQGFAIELAVEPELPPVRFDRDALLQVLFNLVDNAMKYARGTGARRVVLEARRAGPGVEVAVRDFGPGVAQRHLAHIFEPFYRGEDELTRTTQGTGIGLALVRELASRMGARVAGANLPEGGFRVSLAFEAAPVA